MTNGDLFIKENPHTEYKINGSCVWIYFDIVNHYTMPIEWWNKDIKLIEDIKAEIEEEQKGYSPLATYYEAINKVLQIIDKYRK